MYVGMGLRDSRIFTRISRLFPGVRARPQIDGGTLVAARSAYECGRNKYGCDPRTNSKGEDVSRPDLSAGFPALQPGEVGELVGGGAHLQSLLADAGDERLVVLKFKREGCKACGSTIEPLRTAAKAYVGRADFIEGPHPPLALPSAVLLTRAATVAPPPLPMPRLLREVRACRAGCAHQLADAAHRRVSTAVDYNQWKEFCKACAISVVPCAHIYSGGQLAETLALGPSAWGEFTERLRSLAGEPDGEILAPKISAARRAADANRFLGGDL
jgi:hypothetical protein